MADIDFLKELQEYDLEIDRVTDGLKDIEENKLLMKIESEKSQLKERYDDLELEMDRVKNELVSLNRKLKENYFNIDDMNDKLYDGSVTDIKQLDLLNEEQLELKNSTDSLENNTLIVMEKQEILRNEAEKIEKRMEELDRKLGRIKENNLEKLEEYKLVLDRLKLKKEEALYKLGDKAKLEYRSLGGNRKDFMAELRDNRCMGCHMILPVYIIDKVDKDELIKCENCNRILYRNS